MFWYGLPAIVNKGREATYQSLTQFIQQLDVVDPATINCATHPAAPPRNAVISAQYMVLLDDHFLGLRQDGSVQQHSQIASALRQMADQYQAQYATTKIAKKAKVAATLAGWLGEEDFPAALNLMHTRNYL